MKKLKKISAAAYLLVFCLYAISPIITTIPNVSSWQPIPYDDDDDDDDDDSVTIRLMLFEVLADSSPYKETSLGSKSGDDNILLKKKRAILSTKIRLETIIGNSLALDRPRFIQVLTNAEPEQPHYYSTRYFFFSDTSPPSLS